MTIGIVIAFIISYGSVKQILAACPCAKKCAEQICWTYLDNPNLRRCFNSVDPATGMPKKQAWLNNWCFLSCKGGGRAPTGLKYDILDCGFTCSTGCTGFNCAVQIKDVEEADPCGDPCALSMAGLDQKKCLGGE
jgi:hypothetical protein